MSKIILSITDEEPRWAESVADIKQVAEKVKETVFAYVEDKEKLPVLQGQKPLKVNLCLSNNARVQELNRDFRNMDKPTNVLSFVNLDYTDFEELNSPFPEIELGDIIIAYETMEQEAEIENITLYAHFFHLLTHGFLHILGYDHIEDKDAEYMENLEKNILQKLNIADPYAQE